MLSHDVRPVYRAYSAMWADFVNQGFRPQPATGVDIEAGCECCGSTALAEQRFERALRVFGTVEIARDLRVIVICGNCRHAMDV